MSVIVGQFCSHCRRVFSELNNHLVLNRHSKNAKIVKLRVPVEILPEGELQKPSQEVQCRGNNTCRFIRAPLELNTE
jgi:hypothetical protein